MYKQSFHKNLLASAFIMAVFSLVNFGLAFSLSRIHNYFSQRSASMDFQIWFGPILLLLIIGLLKVILIRNNYKVNPFDYIHYYGVYKIISQIIMIPGAVMLFNQYAYNIDELSKVSIIFNILSTVFEIIIGIVLVIWGSRRYKNHQINYDKVVL